VFVLQKAQTYPPHLKIERERGRGRGGETRFSSLKVRLSLQRR
jgi:hypothetical protein